MSCQVREASALPVAAPLERLERSQRDEAEFKCHSSGEALDQTGNTMMRHLKCEANGILFVTLVSLISCDTGDFNLTILHTNDIHAHLEESNKYGGTCFPELKNKSKCVGGVARIVQKVKEIRNETPDALFLNAGDFFQGTPYYTLFKQEVISAIMSVMGYDYACLGNHEFDDGPSNLAPFLEKMNKSNVTIIGTNTDFSKDPELKNWNLVKSTTKEICGRKVGFLGAVIPTTKHGSSPGPHVEFYDEKEAFRSETRKLKEQNVSIIIAITHSGYDREKDIVNNVSEIDILVGGHTNTFLYTGEPPAKEDKPEGDYPYVVNRSDGSQALVVQDYRFGKYLGRLDVTFNSTGHVVGWGGNPILLNASVEEDAEMKKVLEPFKVNLTKRMAEVVGSTRVLMEHKDDICRLQECNLGNLIADAYFAYYLNHNMVKPPAWSDINGALVNAGGIRTSLPSFYNVTWGDVVTTLPYGNSLVTVTLTGNDLRHMFEHAVTGYNTSKDMPKGRFLQVSGFRVKYNLTKPEHNRVELIKVLCSNCSVPMYKNITFEQTYSIVTSDFVARGGDGFKFSNSVIVSDVGPIEYEALEKFIFKMSPMWTPNEGRIKITWNETDKEAIKNYTRMMRENQKCENGICTRQ
ncbi:protein 5NUC isoform X1 [Rhipicephalus microplus]|uniref:protein 5NUC isoform X1 n=1 Tax=Rhipicephalus microplus TaxID=6941 RepID=UPI003F6C3CA3